MSDMLCSTEKQPCPSNLACPSVPPCTQNVLLFNPTFAKSLRRGQLVRTIGLNKADLASQQPHIASIEGAVSAVVADAGVGPLGGEGGSKDGAGRSRGASLVHARLAASAMRSHTNNSVGVPIR